MHSYVNNVHKTMHTHACSCAFATCVPACVACLCMCAHVHMHVRGHAHLVFYMYVRVCLYICVFVCMSLHVCTCASTCVYMCVYVWCVRVCVARLCLTLGNPVDYSPPISSPGILQARILEWVAISSSRGSSWPRDQTHIPCVSRIVGGFFTAVPLGKPFVNLVSKHLSQSFLNFYMDINF